MGVEVEVFRKHEDMSLMCRKPQRIGILITMVDFDQQSINNYFWQNHYMAVKIMQKFLHLIICCGGSSYIMSDDSQLQLIGLYLD